MNTVIPRPRIRQDAGKDLVFSEKGKALSVAFLEVSPEAAKAVAGGVRLLNARLQILGGGQTRVVRAQDSPTLTIEKCSASTLAGALQKAGTKGHLDAKRLDQAYILESKPAADGKHRVLIRASSDLGLYYGLVTLCQLVDKDDDSGRFVVPATMIADWPGDESGTKDVINLVCASLEKQHPDAYILFCTSVSGSIKYRGKATPEMKTLFSTLPEKVWPLWTGPETLLSTRLTGGTVENWTRTAGRRPFFWLNRVACDAPAGTAQSAVATEWPLLFQ